MTTEETQDEEFEFVIWEDPRLFFPGDLVTFESIKGTGKFLHGHVVGTTEDGYLDIVAHNTGGPRIIRPDRVFLSTPRKCCSRFRMSLQRLKGATPQ